ncbi:MAG: 16S rRNA (cytosine(967)-C(5))-methyltransferase RsmB [Lachnospiraceae bacterium]|nr:16S rRNA (cytosine(967)-C(5))-methyltransferase RsmB [Lachnospiraceae bacterium]
MDARETALRILLEVERGEKSHIVLQNTWMRHPEISEQDRRFILRLVQGTLEKRLQLDWRINQKSRVPVAKMKPVIRNLLRMSAFQLFYMDRVPASAVCNEAVKLTGRFHMQGLKGFVNGVLRAMAREEAWPEEPLCISSSVPEWILDRWRTEYGVEALTGLLRSLEEPHRLTVRRVTSRVSEPELLNSLEAEGASVSPAPFPGDAFQLRVPGKLEELTAYRRGWFQIQDLSSMLVGCLAGIRPGQRVLDVCAAPGGKSLHAADLLAGTGEVLACDLSEAKAARIRENIARSGLSNIQAVVQDATVFVSAWEGQMDVVLADLPCSGLGVMGRKPEIRYSVTPEQVKELAALQRQILANVWRYVRPGGTLLYSTCTVTREENAENRGWILEELPFRADEFGDSLPEALQGERSVAEGFLQLLPGMQPCDGFYIARFRRKQCGE